MVGRLMIFESIFELLSAGHNASRAGHWESFESSFGLIAIFCHHQGGLTFALPNPAHYSGPAQLQINPHPPPSSLAASNSSLLPFFKGRYTAPFSGLTMPRK